MMSVLITLLPVDMNELIEFVLYLIGGFILMIIAIAMMLVIIGPFIWMISCKSADIYNKTHNTHWTCSDFFWAGDQINTQSQTIHLTQ